MSSIAQPGRASAQGELPTIGLVGLAHFTSHSLQFAFAPLIPLMRPDLGVGFADLGLVLTAFYATSGLGQVMAGILVDRLGAHRMLVAGMLLQATAVFGMGFVPSFLWLFPLAVMAGLGNTVYHPADLSILNHRVPLSRLGRAFAVHQAAGSIGFGTWPMVVGLIGTNFGWRTAVICSGLFGWGVLTLLLLSMRRISVNVPSQRPAAAGAPRRASVPFSQIIVMPAVISGFLYFFFGSVAGGGTTSFGPATLTAVYAVPFALATIMVTAFQFASTGGVVVGGFLADRVRRHELIAFVGVLVAALSLLLAAEIGTLPAIAAGFVAAGLCVGVSVPSRDLLVRQSAPEGSLGRVVGTVYAGLDAGGVVGPLIYGFLLDHGHGGSVLVVSAGVLALSAVPILVLGASRRRGQKIAQRASVASP